MEDIFFKIYLKEIENYRLLTHQEEILLAEKIAAGDKSAYEKLVKSNLRLVVFIANKFSGSNVSVMDLIQEGNIGLMMAAKKYDVSFGIRFGSYAYSWILQAMFRYLCTKNCAVRIPGRKTAILRRVENARMQLAQHGGKKVSDREVASYTGIPENEVRSASAVSYFVCSIDAKCLGTDDMTLGDVIPDPHNGPEDDLMCKIAREEAHSLLNTVSEKERFVVYRRFNFACDEKVMTLREIGTLLGVSAESVRRMEKRAICHMRSAALALEVENILKTA